MPWGNPNNIGDARHATLQHPASPALVEGPTDADHSCLMVLSSGEPSSCTQQPIFLSMPRCITLLEGIQCHQTTHFDCVAIVRRLRPITATINTACGAALVPRPSGAQGAMAAGCLHSSASLTQTNLYSCPPITAKHNSRRTLRCSPSPGLVTCAFITLVVSFNFVRYPEFFVDGTRADLRKGPNQGPRRISQHNNNSCAKGDRLPRQLSHVMHYVMPS